MDAPLEDQRALLELQRHDSAVDRLTARRGSLPEDARLAELAGGLAVVDQLAAERRGSLATLQREQARLEDEIDMVTRKAHSEEDRAASGRVTSPKELTAIQEEVAALKRRQSALEDDLLERMEQRETLEAELAELDSRREAITAEQAEVTRDRDAALVEIDADLATERAAADEVAPRVGGELRALYDQVRKRQGGVGRRRPGRRHLPGLPGVDLRRRAGRAPQAAARDRQALRELPPHPGGRLNPDEVVVWTDGGARGNPGPAGYGVVVTTPGGEVLAQLAEGIGWATNNVAEYRGAIAGLEQALALGARRVRVRADSLLVVNQQKGLWKVKNPALRVLWAETRRLAGQFERVTWEHVPRERNRRADALANQAMDAQGVVERPVEGLPRT